MHLALASMAGGLALATVAVVARHRNPPRAWGWAFVVLLFVAAVFAITGCAEGSFVDAPPKRYQTPGMYAVRTVPTSQIASACAGGSRVGERQVGSVMGCTKGFIVTLPNPCEWKADAFAALTCHEFAHGRPSGWANDHPR